MTEELVSEEKGKLKKGVIDTEDTKDGQAPSPVPPTNEEIRFKRWLERTISSRWPLDNRYFDKPHFGLSPERYRRFLEMLKNPEIKNTPNFDEKWLAIIEENAPVPGVIWEEKPVRKVEVYTRSPQSTADKCDVHCEQDVVLIANGKKIRFDGGQVIVKDLYGERERKI